VKPLQIYCDFCDFQHGGCRHLEFSKIGNFNGLSAVEGQYASSCQILSKSVKQFFDSLDSGDLPYKIVEN